MDRAWWLRAVLILALVVMALGSLVPTVAMPEKGEPVPSWLTSYMKVWNNRLNLGLDLQGGLLLQYRVEVEKAVIDKADRLEEDMVKRLKDKDAELQVTSAREGMSEIKLTFADPAKTSLVDEDFLSFFPNMVMTEDGGTLSFKMSTEYIETIQENAIEQAIGTIRERVDALGVAEPDIKKAGLADIVIQLPGLNEEDFERAKNLIGTTAQLEFKMVAESDMQGFFSKHQSGLPAGLEYKVENGQPTVTARDKDALKAYFKGKVDDKHQVVFEEIVFYTDKTKTVKDENRSYWRTHLVFDEAELTGEYITDARVSNDNRTNKPYVSLTFDSTGAELFGRTTTENVGKRFGIILDDTLKSDPVINEPIPGGRAQITMGGYKSLSETYQESRDLVLVLQHGALPAPIHKQFETSVGPSLGADSVRKGRMALLIASALVVVFMLIYYKGGGIIANIALILNMIFIMAGLTALNATLTLPGIAGIILTIGMAVDANVIIFERVKEELYIGKSPKAAINAGYGKALSAVLDANITTAIAAAVLMQYGTGPIRGFAVTLLLGIVSSVFTAVIVTRLFYDFIIQRMRPERLSI
ncbi:MAG: protein translocase subunit SecD [Myxococcales bacterium]|nr:protein translocase subunit SecD [Myxococcales bacterium]